MNVATNEKFMRNVSAKMDQVLCREEYKNKKSKPKYTDLKISKYPSYVLNLAQVLSKITPFQKKYKKENRFE